MQRLAFSLDMGSAIAALLSMSLLGLILFYLIEFLDDRIVFWRRDQRMAAVSRRRRDTWHARSTTSFDKAKPTRRRTI